MILKKSFILFFTFLISMALFSMDDKFNTSKGAFFESVIVGDLKQFKKYIKKGGDIHIVEKHGQTLLHSAFNWDPEIIDINSEKKELRLKIRQSKKEIADILISKGLNINIKDERGRTPLSVAITHGDYPGAVFLIKKHANLNIKHKNGNTILHELVSKYNFYLWKSKFIRLLIEKKANLGIKNKAGLTPYELFIKSQKSSELHWLVMLGSLKGMRKLSAKKLSQLIDQKDKNGETPLHLAAYNNDYEIVKFLLSNGANPNLKNKNNQSPAFYSLEKQKIKTALLLIKKGADVNIRGQYGQPLITYAVENNNFQLTKTLLEKGADVNSTSQAGYRIPIFQLALERKNYRILELLLKNNARLNFNNYARRKSYDYYIHTDSKFKTLLSKYGKLKKEKIINKKQSESGKSEKINFPIFLIVLIAVSLIIAFILLKLFLKRR